MVPRGLARASHQPARMSGDVTDGCSGHTSGKCRTLTRELRYGTPVASRTSGLNDPSGDGRNREIPDNADDKEHDIDAVGGFEREVRVVLQLRDVVLKHQHLNLRQHGTEQVGDGQPQINLNIAAEPLRERGVKAVPDGDSERYRAEDGKDNQEERPQRVDQQCGSGEKQLQHLAEEVADAFLHVVSTALDIHSGHRDHIARRPAQLFELPVELLVRDEVGRFGVAHHRLVFELVFLFAVLVHVECLRFEHPVRTLYDGA